MILLCVNTLFFYFELCYVDGRWSKAAKKAFEELTFCAQWQVLMARVIRYCGDDPCVELIDTNNTEVRRCLKILW